MSLINKLCKTGILLTTLSFCGAGCKDAPTTFIPLQNLEQKTIKIENGFTLLKKEYEKLSREDREFEIEKTKLEIDLPDLTKNKKEAIKNRLDKAYGPPEIQLIASVWIGWTAKIRLLKKDKALLLNKASQSRKMRITHPRWIKILNRWKAKVLAPQKCQIKTLAASTRELGRKEKYSEK